MQMKRKPHTMIPFGRNRHAALFYDGDQDEFVCAIGYHPLDSADSYTCTREHRCAHPMEALTIYEGTFCPGIRAKYGEWLENEIGCNSYTGQKIRQKKTHCPPTQR